MSLSSKGKPKSLEHRKALSIAKLRNPVRHWLGKERPDMRGENNPRWIKNRNEVKIGDRKLHDVNYKQWHFAVKNRDGWKCRISNSNCSGRVEAHHILRWRDYPELRYEITNGITLCHFHHPRGRKLEEEMQSVFQDMIAGKAK